MGDMTMRLGSSSGPTFTGVNSPLCAAIFPAPEFPDPYHPLLRTNTAIDRKGVAGDVPGLVGQQPHHSVGDFVWLANPPHRDKSGCSAGFEGFSPGHNWDDATVRR